MKVPIIRFILLLGILLGDSAKSKLLVRVGTFVEVALIMFVGVVRKVEFRGDGVYEFDTKHASPRIVKKKKKKKETVEID